MKLWRKIGLLGIALAGLILLLMPVPAFAQSCALCYTQAASSGTRMIQALRSGILILIVPSDAGNDWGDFCDVSQAQSGAADGVR
jgi:hypothetical protein